MFEEIEKEILSYKSEGVSADERVELLEKLLEIDAELKSVFDTLANLPDKEQDPNEGDESLQESSNDNNIKDIKKGEKNKSKESVETTKVSKKKTKKKRKKILGIL